VPDQDRWFGAISAQANIEQRRRRSVMKNSIFAEAFLVAALASSTVTAWSQNAPGEDPVILSKRVTVQMLPIGGGKTSAPMQNVADMPAWIKAKVARYEARFNSEQTEGMATDANVTRTATSDGLKKTCIQEVGSNTVAPASNGGRVSPNNQQIVVLRGDLVNICK
jgi:hypothetical protein